MENEKEMTLADAFEEFLVSRMASGVQDITIKTYRSHFQSIGYHLDTTMQLSKIEKHDINCMVVSMRSAGLKDVTIQTYTRCLKTIFNWANSEGLTSLKVTLYRANKSMKTPYTDEELCRLLEMPDSECPFWELRDWTIVNFLISTGCRASTLRAIKIKDIDLERANVVFSHTKNGSTQMMPLCNTMCEVLKVYLKRRGGGKEDPLFCNPNFEPLTHPALYKSIQKYNHSRAVQKTSIHLFRHTFAKKFLLDCRGDAFTLQHLLGHKTLEMTRRYCDLYDADIANRFEEICPLNQIRPERKGR